MYRFLFLYQKLYQFYGLGIPFSVFMEKWRWRRCCIVRPDWNWPIRNRATRTDNSRHTHMIRQRRTHTRRSNGYGEQSFNLLSIFLCSGIFLSNSIRHGKKRAPFFVTRRFQYVWKNQDAPTTKADVRTRQEPISRLDCIIRKSDG